MKSLVSIIIVNWNGNKWLEKCFRTLSVQNYKNFEVVFVDNASRDDSVSWVKNNYPKTKVIINKENLGFAEANNVGYRVVKGKYVLFLNNDTYVTKTFLSELVRVVETDSTIGGVQSKILLMDHPDTHDSVGAFLTPTGFLYHYGFGKKDISQYNRQIELYTAKGACMMFRKDVLDRVSVHGKIFDPDYFAYFEESDMCHRVWLAGYRIVYAYTSVIYHKMGATSINLNNAFVQYHSFKNRIATYVKNLNGYHLVTVLSVHLLFCELYALMMLFRRKWQMFYAIQKAIWWNMIHIKRIYKRRIIVQTMVRKVTDSEIWSLIMKKPSYKYYFSLLKGKLDYDEN